MAAGSTQDSIRKVLGAIKDSTKVGLAQINSEFKDLDVAIVKATNHVESPPKEKHIRTIFAATSAGRPRADVAYCIHALARRISKTHNWTVAVKCLIVIHRTLREGDPTFREELINYSRSRRLAFNLTNFRDDSSPNAWDYSAWVRAYALYLEERLECYRILRFDIESNHYLKIKELDTPELLEQLPSLQQLLYRLIGCQPEGAAFSNFVIQCALSLILKESVRIYHAINDGMINLVDKFFEMQKPDATQALEIYRRGGQQTEKLSEFYDVCRGLDISRSMKFPPLEQPPHSFLSTMEQYVRDAPRQSSVSRKDSLENQDSVKKNPSVLALPSNKPQNEESQPPPPAEAREEEKEKVPPPAPIQPVAPAAATENVDLLGLDDAKPDVSALEESNALALAIVPTADSTPTVDANVSNTSAGVTGWELALVTTTSSNDSAINQSKLAGGFDRLTLDSLYDDAMTRQAYSTAATTDPMAQTPYMTSSMHANPQVDPFFASNGVAPPQSVQMATLAQQQQAMMMQQQSLMMQHQMMGGMQQQQSLMMQQQMMGGMQQPMNAYSYGMPYMTPVTNQYQSHVQTNPFG